MAKEAHHEVLIAGGGIGGLATALACVHQGLAVKVLERAAHFSEVGAGIQIGPNVTRILHAWGLQAALTQCAAFPEALRSMDARSGKMLGILPLAQRAQDVYGAPYATIHRADLHGLLFNAITARGVAWGLGQTVCSWGETQAGLEVQTASGQAFQAAALVGADGLWSAVRQQLLGDGGPRFTGHLAYRAMVAQADLPQALRSQEVTVWMGPRLHVVHYPVRGGEWLNMVAIVHGELPQRATEWSHEAPAEALMNAVDGACTALRDRLSAVSEWRLWALHDRPPLTSAHSMAQGRVALLGDAAHPMRPYLAQGAGMAIEDAQVLAQCLSKKQGTVAERLQDFAQRRWARNARVQARAIRNGRIFHAQGPVAAARNVGLHLLGARLMDLPWLFGQGPST